MAIPTTNISMRNDLNSEVIGNITDTNISLRSISRAGYYKNKNYANLGVSPDAISEFRNYTKYVYTTMPHIKSDIDSSFYPNDSCKIVGMNVGPSYLNIGGWTEITPSSMYVNKTTPGGITPQHVVGLSLKDSDIPDSFFPISADIEIRCIARNRRSEELTSNGIGSFLFYNIIYCNSYNESLTRTSCYLKYPLPSNGDLNETHSIHVTFTDKNEYILIDTLEMAQSYNAPYTLLNDGNTYHPFYDNYKYIVWGTSRSTTSPYHVINPVAQCCIYGDNLDELGLIQNPELECAFNVTKITNIASNVDLDIYNYPYNYYLGRIRHSFNVYGNGYLYSRIIYSFKDDGQQSCYLINSNDHGVVGDESTYTNRIATENHNFCFNGVYTP